ncbi:hypothetical protein [Clostridium beijerinckii]|uniref:Uncharacterized protein n=1 Tax=Clostridium beijerinckii TaxID=1520 RepID=A0AAE5H8A5_CLOBE|nr:hypothetical protein [Clostridium beijerinckii]NSB17150.1 hypothetical protein [Clostridium beijerinckii]OOM33765.1 hypothetical protein CLOBE_05210 [Clostridium beijerinckii]
MMSGNGTVKTVIVEIKKRNNSVYYYERSLNEDKIKIISEKWIYK